MKPFAIASLAALLAAPTVALAADYPAPIKAMQERGIEVLEKVDAPANLTAYTALYQGRPLVLYVTADNKHALIGSLLDEQGTDLTGSVVEEKIVRPQGEKMWAEMEKMDWIKDGSDKAKQIAYVFTDPNCPYCKKFWADARPWVDAGEVQLRHFVVGMLSEGSAKKAASILMAKDQTKALNDNESGKKAAKEITVSAAVKKQLDTNMQMMQGLGASGTPAIFYKDETGLLQLQPGAASAEKLVEMFGAKPKK